MNTTQENLDKWNKDLPQHIADFDTHSEKIADNVTLTKAHLEEAMQEVAGQWVRSRV